MAALVVSQCHGHGPLSNGYRLNHWICCRSSKILKILKIMWGFTNQKRITQQGNLFPGASRSQNLSSQIKFKASHKAPGKVFLDLEILWEYEIQIRELIICGIAALPHQLRKEYDLPPTKVTIFYRSFTLRDRRHQPWRSWCRGDDNDCYHDVPFEKDTNI